MRVMDLTSTPAAPRLQWLHLPGGLSGQLYGQLPRPMGLLTDQPPGCETMQTMWTLEQLPEQLPGQSSSRLR